MRESAAISAIIISKPFPIKEVFCLMQCMMMIFFTVDLKLYLLLTFLDALIQRNMVALAIVFLISCGIWAIDSIPLSSNHEKM